MALNDVQIDLIIQTAESAKNLGDLRKSMQEVRKTLDQVEVGSTAFTKLNATLDDGAERLRTFRRGFDGLKAFETFGRTITSSFGAASAAIGVFAEGNDELQKSLNRVASALTLIQSFSSLAESMKLAREANLALNASLLTNPYVLVAAGILAVGAAFLTTGEDAKKSAKDIEDWNTALQESYLLITNDIISTYDQQVQDLNNSLLTQQEILTGTVKIREAELAAVLADQNVTEEGIKGQIQSLNELKNKRTELLRQGTGSAADKIELDRLTSAIKQQTGEVQALRKAQGDLLKAKKDLFDFNSKDKEKVVEQSKYTELYADELYSLTKAADAFLLKQLELNKISRYTYNSFTEVSTSIQSNSIAYQNLIKGIKDFDPSELEAKLEKALAKVPISLNTFKQLSKEAQDAIAVIQPGAEFKDFDSVIKSIIESQRQAINQQFEILNTALIETPSKFAETAKIIAKKSVSEQIGIYTELYQRLIELGSTPEEAQKKLSSFNFQLTTELTGLQQKLVAGYGLTDVAAKNVANQVNGYFKDANKSIVEFKTKLEAGLIIPENVAKANRKIISDLEAQYASLTDVLSHQEDVTKQVGATSRQIAKQKYDDIIIEKTALESLISVVEKSILPDDEKSKKITELTAKVEEYRQALELLGIELGKPKDQKLVGFLTEEQEQVRQTFDKTASFINGQNSQLFSLFQQASDQRIAILEAEKQRALDLLQGQFDTQLISQQQYREKAALIEEEYRQKEREEKKAAFAAEKAGKIIEAIINTALAVSAAIAVGPPAGYILAAISGALGAAQIGIIASQPTPEYATGGYVAGPGSATSDSINAKISNGEYIVNSKSTSAFRPLLDQINYGMDYGFTRLNSETKAGKETTNQVTQNDKDIRVSLVYSDVQLAAQRTNDIKVKTTF